MSATQNYSELLSAYNATVNASRMTEAIYNPVNLPKLPYYITVLVLMVPLNLIQAIIFAGMKNRTFSNLLFLSIAVSDLISGVFLLPMYAVARIFISWPLGAVSCHVYLSLNHVTYTNLCMLSYHRYRQVTQPFGQSEAMNTRRYIFLAIPWVAFFAFYTLMSVQQGLMNEFDYITCRFYYNPIFVFGEGVFFFMIPTFLTVIFSAITMRIIIKKKFTSNLKIANLVIALNPHKSGTYGSNNHQQNLSSLQVTHSNTASDRPASRTVNFTESLKRLKRNQIAVICIIVMIVNSLLSQGFLFFMYPFTFLCRCEYDLFNISTDILFLYPLLNPILLFVFHETFKSELVQKVRKLRKSLLSCA